MNLRCLGRLVNDPASKRLGNGVFEIRKNNLARRDTCGSIRRISTTCCHFRNHAVLGAQSTLKSTGGKTHDAKKRTSNSETTESAIEPSNASSEDGTLSDARSKPLDCATSDTRTRAEDAASSGGRKHQDTPAVQDTKAKSRAAAFADNLRDLDALIENLQQLGTASPDVTEVSHPSTNLPQSPILQRISRRKTTKRKATKSEENRYATNEWAQMLSQPVRRCQGTGARMPRNMMNAWDFVEDPENGHAYFMPADLADLDCFRPQDQQQVNSNGVLKANVPRLVNTRFVPDIQLLRHLTKSMGTSKAAQSGKSRVQRLVRSRVKMRIAAATHYEALRKSSLKATGDTDRGSAYTETEIDLGDLQWKDGVDVIVLELLRERVMLGLIKLIEANDNETCRAANHLITVPLPDSGRLYLQDDRNTNMTGAVAAKLTASEQQETPRWPIAGSYCLHFGTLSLPPRSTAVQNVDETSSTSQSKVNVPPLPDNPLIPPMVVVNDIYRLPVFSVHDLLDADRYTKFKEVTDPRSVVSTPDPCSGIEPCPLGRSDGQEAETRSLVLVRPTARSQATALRELWQLWRYIGGREMSHLSA